MAEEEVNYASVVFKSNKSSPPEAKKEETVYDEVKVRNQKTVQAADANVSAGFLPDKNANSQHRCYQQVACTLGILCVILLLGVIVLGVYPVDTKQNQNKENQTALQVIKNLTNLNDKLRSENEKLSGDYNNLTVRFDNLTQAYAVLASKITSLTAENQNLTTQNHNLLIQNQNLTTQNQQLEREKNNLTQQIQNMETNWNELNVSRAQWSIDAYCPKENTVRQCKACQKGWAISQSSCYAVNNPQPPGQKTWEEARGDCRGKISDLVVIVDQTEKTFISSNSWGSSETSGYWIGLRAEGGKWKWVDGSDLTVSYWIHPPPAAAANGQCATSVENKGWKSVSCGDTNRWICKKKALSV